MLVIVLQCICFFSIMFAKFAIEEILPIVIANAACGMNLEFPRKLYVLTFATILGLYIIIEYHCSDCKLSASILWHNYSPQFKYIKD